MDISSSALATQAQPASHTLDSIFEAVEDAGNVAAKLIILSRHDEQLIKLLHDLINDLCVARIGTQLLQQQVGASVKNDVAKAASSITS